jgi:hypothetical protein
MLPLSAIESRPSNPYPVAIPTELKYVSLRSTTLISNVFFSCDSYLKTQNVQGRIMYDCNVVTVVLVCCNVIKLSKQIDEFQTCDQDCNRGISPLVLTAEEVCSVES